MTDPMHQLLDKMQALMGKHRDAPVMLEAEPAPFTDEASKATPFPVLTDIVRRGEILAGEPPVAPQPVPDFTVEIAPPIEVTDSTPEAFTSTEQTGSFANVEVTPILTDIVWRDEALADVPPSVPQPAPDFAGEIALPVEVTDITETFTSTEQAEPFAAVDATPVLADIAWHGEVLADAPPFAPQPAPDTNAEIAHPAATADSIPAAFTSPEQAELLANSVATHVLGMIDGHLMYQVNTVMAQRLRRVMDDTLSTLLTQLALDIESIVREAVAEELARHGIRPADTPENPSNPV
ncbi:MAG TPA: hypothetical protein VMV97_07980 [Sulfuriferula sp.]|nr:hypothetical protein [Sulfuriferula sp.]